MKVFVEVGCEIDPLLNVRIDKHSGEPVPDPGDKLYRVGLAGRWGVELALGMPGAAVTAFAKGFRQREALRHALAAGATRAVELCGTVTEGSVAAWLCEEKADLVIAGTSAGLFAFRNGWAHVAGVVALDASDKSLRAIRSLGRGEREEVEALLPAAVRLSVAELGEPHYIARARVLAVKDSAVDFEILSGVAEPSFVEMGAIQPFRPRARLGGSSVAPAVPAKASDRLAALMGGAGAKRPAALSETKARTPEEMAEEFIRYLAHHDLLEDRK